VDTLHAFGAAVILHCRYWVSFTKVHTHIFVHTTCVQTFSHKNHNS